jgi:8-oxo-dGTP pyrophosphatase MutT (NUDIX family)
MSEPEPPRQAASLLLLRHGAAETQVLMGARSVGHRFRPNRLVFPGGVVDQVDYTAPAAGEAAPRVLRRLADDDPALARALTHAAARELEEETGLHLGAPPDLSGMDYLCRAVTPARMEIRFDARFLVIDADLVSGTLAGSGELESLTWFGIGQALELDLAYPTRKVLERTLQWLALDAAERLAEITTPTLRERAWHPR